MIVIHVGLRKAGSTSLQALLKNNQEPLHRLSVDYARIGRLDKPAHHNFAREIITALKKFNPERGTLSDLTSYWRTAPHKTLVLSSELLEEAEIDQIAIMRDHLSRARAHEEFRIVLILRDLIDLMPSSYAQKVKFGVETHNFDRFFEERMTARRVNYFDTAKRWADVFGWNALHLRLLDRQYLANGDLLDDFMMICGVSAEAIQTSNFERPGNSNSAPGWRVLESVRALFDGRHGLSADDPLPKVTTRNGKMALGKLAIKAGNRRKWNEDKGAYLTTAQAQRCLEVFETNIAAFDKYLSSPLPRPPDLKSRGFRERDFLPDIKQIAKHEVRAFYQDVRRLKAGAVTYPPKGSGKSHNRVQLSHKQPDRQAGRSGAMR